MAGFVREEAPGKQAELERDFDDLYEKVEESLRELGDDLGGGQGSWGLPFDPSFGAGLFVGTALWVAAVLLREALAAPDKRQRERRLKKVETKLWAHTGSPEIVIDLLARLLRAIERLPGNPDLVLLIDRDHRDNRLVYRLQPDDPATGFSRRSFLSPRLEREPVEYFEQLLWDVGRWSKTKPEKSEVGGKKLENIGTSVTHQLMPPDLRELLWSLRGTARTLEIVSEEPWIPWELVRLWSAAGSGPAAGQFLAEAFAVTHWLSARASPEQRQEVFWFPLRNIALVVPQGGGLPKAAKERELVQSLSGQERRVACLAADYLTVQQALGSGEFDGWHFTCHGMERGSHPDQWGLILEDAETLTGFDLATAGPGLSKTRPLMFLNSCASARSGRNLTGLGGIAVQLLEAGAGAVIGTHWNVSDHQAAAFVESFYPRFLSGRPLGEALRESRIHLRDRFPGASTWLAYAAFGHPLATVG